MRAQWWVWGCLLALETTALAQSSEPAAPAQPRDRHGSVAPVTRDRVASPPARTTAPLARGSVKIDLRASQLSTSDAPAPGRAPASGAEPVAEARPPAKRIALALEGTGQDGEALKLVAGQGSLARGGSVEVPRASVAVVGSSAARQIAARSKLTSTEKTPLPWMVVDDDPAAPLDRRQLRATRPFLQLAEPVRWDGARGLHVAEFWFGLDVEQGEPGPLARPIQVLFSVTCSELDPRDRVQIGETGVAGYARISVGCSPSEKNADAPERLSLRLDEGQLDYPFEIPRLPGTPSLFSSTKRAEGLGLSSIDLTVSHREQDGTLLPVTHDLPVTLTTESGALDVTQLVIPKGATEASVSVRPRGVGQLRVTARLGGASSETAQIELGWPTLATFASVLGGGLGGLLAARNKRQRRLSRIVEGALVGLVVTALCLVLPDFSALGGYLRTTEVALFALSAIAGFVGSHLIERAARVLFPSLRSGSAADKSPA